MTSETMTDATSQAAGRIARTTWKIQWTANNPDASEIQMADAWETDKKQYYSIERCALAVVSANGIKIG